MDSAIQNTSKKKHNRGYKINIQSHEIKVERYIVPIPKEESSQGITKRGEILEKAWREINALDGFDQEDGGIEVRRDGEDIGRCAVISRGEDGVGLWVFGGEAGIEGLTRTTSKTIDIRKLVTCSIHGHDLSCLDCDRKCDVKFDFGEMKDDWVLFGYAILEKMFWKVGKRVEKGLESCQLWPISNDKMILIVKPSDPELQAQNNLGQSIPASTLHPLNLKAIHIGNCSPTAAQAISLESSFTNSLGQAYKIHDSSTGFDLDKQLGFEQSQWGVYWVFQDMMDRPLLGDLKGKNGILTIWPNSLVSTRSSDATMVDSGSVTVPRDLEDYDQLMSLSTGLYDFMASYEPPSESVEEITPETNGGFDVPSPPLDFSNTSPEQEQDPIEIAGQDDLFGVSAQSPESDMDDLFGDHSPTPPIFDHGGDAGTSFDQDVEMSSSPMNAEESGTVLSPAASAAIGRNPERPDVPEPALVTEDDFDFFDSPGDEPDLTDLQDVLAIANDSVASGAVEPNSIQPRIEDDPRPTEKKANPVVLPAPAQAPPTPEAEPQEPAVNIASGELAADTALPLEVSEPRQPTRRTVTFAKSPSPTPVPVTPPVDTVPSPFGPLDIEPTVPSFAYSLPSPAASPETDLPHFQLRSDLLARLQGAKDTKKFDYASEWDLGSDDASDMETEEDDSGAPPTPVSIGDTDTQPSATSSPTLAPRRETEQIQWEGSELIGADWIGMRWEESFTAEAGRTWKDSWAKGKLISSDEEVKRLKLEGADWDRLAGELASSQHLRDLLVDALPLRGLFASENTKSTVGLVNSDDTSALPQTQIHVGYGGNVCQLSIAALRYWQQLGLQPVGGPKNLKALTVCTPDNGSVGMSKDFLHSIAEIYESCQLGRHLLGESAVAREGVIAIPAAGFVASIAALLPTLVENTVIYVLLPLLAPAPLAEFVGKLLSTTIPLADTTVVKLIPPNATLPDQTQQIAFEVYNQLPRPIQPISLRGLRMGIPDTQMYAQYPAWTLSPDKPVRPELTLNWPLKSYDVLNRWRIVHAAYGVDVTRKSAMGYVIDDQGEGWATKTLALGENGIGGVIEGLWVWFKEFAMKCSAEYRLIICAVGSMTKLEVEAWKALIEASKLPATLVISQFSQVDEKGGYIPRNAVQIPPSTFIDQQSRIIDDDLTTGLEVLPRIPIQIGEVYHVPKYSFTYSTKSIGVFDILYHVSPDKTGLGFKPDNRDSEPVENVVDLVGGSFYRLTCLAKMRLGIEQGGPVHVEVVKMGLRSLELIS